MYSANMSTFKPPFKTNDQHLGSLDQKEKYIQKALEIPLYDLVHCRNQGQLFFVAYYHPNPEFQIMAAEKITFMPYLDVLRTTSDRTPMLKSLVGLRMAALMRPPQQPLVKGRSTLVLDIDETLVHSEIGDDNKSIEITLRPGVADFLKWASGTFELIAFTAGDEDYIPKVMRIIDPDRKIFSDVLIRESCSVFIDKGEEIYVKDLARLGRDPDKILLLDDRWKNGLAQPGNILPMLRFEGTNEIPYLESLKEALEKHLQTGACLRDFSKQTLNYDAMQNDLQVRREKIIGQNIPEWV